MKIAFFNCLPIEYGGGTARFFIDAALGLKRQFIDTDISLVTLDENLSKKVNSLYSLYFQRDIGKELIKDNSDLRKFLLRQKINYLKVADFQSLRKTLAEFDVVYSKNDLLEAFILKFLAGQKIKKLIYGFHTPVYYERPAKLQDYLHNFLYSSWLYKNLIDKAAKFHVINQFDKLLLRKYFPEKNIQKIYNPFDFASFAEVNFRNKKRSLRNSNQLKYISKVDYNLKMVGLRKRSSHYFL